MFRRKSVWALLLAVVLALAGLGRERLSPPPPPEPGSAVSQRAGGAEIAIGELPPEARETLARVRQGGPFPFAKDATRFGNREGLLPDRPRDYYTEYTVRTPGASDRGARRIVAGGDARRSGEYYYTDDHYRSFRRIRE